MARHLPSTASTTPFGGLLVVARYARNGHMTAEGTCPERAQNGPDGTFRPACSLRLFMCVQACPCQARVLLSKGSLVGRRVPTSLDSKGLKTALDELEQHGANSGDPEFYACLLRSCGKAKDLAAGRRVHTYIRGSEHHRITYLGNLLVEMYGKCGRLEDARLVFDYMFKPNEYSWNIMTAAYAQSGQLQEARNIFDRMPEKSVVSWNAMIAAYARRGDLSEARDLFDKVPDRNLVSWNTMVSGYAQHGHLEEARALFDRILQKDVVSWTTMVAAHAQKGDLQQAKSMFEQMPERNVVSWNAMIAAYTQNRHLREARITFDRMSQRDVVSWTTMVTAYAQNNGQLEEARDVFEHMPERDGATWNAMTSAYAQHGNLQEASTIFERMPNKDTVSWNAMLTAYVEKGQLQDAIIIFDKIPQKDVVSWTAMTGGYAQNGLLEEARDMFNRMPQKDCVSWIAMITAYAQHGALQEARTFFNLMPQRSISAWNTMITAYAQSGQLCEARTTFDDMPEHDTVSWNAMIAGNAQNDRSQEGIRLFRQMDLLGIQMDGITVLSALDACTNSLAFTEGQAIHASIVENGLQLQVAVGNALINMYGKFGRVENAKKVFDEMRQRDVVSFNAMVSAYAQNGHLQEAKELFDDMTEHDVVSWNIITGGYAQYGECKEAINLFCLMDLAGIRANEITFLIVVDACASIAALQEGNIIRSVIVDSGLQVNLALGNVLINMYGKCGSMQDARDVFDKMLRGRDAVSWNTMVAAYAQYGHIKDALELFETMNLDGIAPDEITFIAVLSVCAHAGLVKDGRVYFLSMVGDYGFAPIADHYVCMIDILGRAGQLNQAEELINSMPFEPGSVTWMSLLGACNLHGDGPRGVRAAGLASELDPKDSSAYVLLSNMYKL